LALDRRSTALRLVQFFPFLALLLLFLLFPAKYTATSYWLVAATLYALAKLLELFDHAIYSFGSVLSGHTLSTWPQLLLAWQF